MNWIISQWSVRQVGDKWCVAKFRQARMHIAANGGLSIGDGTLEWGPEIYEFDTERAALAQMRFCEKTERIWSDLFDPYTTLSFSTPMLVHGGLTRDSRSNSDTFRVEAPSGKVLWAVDKYGRVTHFALTDFVQAWLKNTAPIRGLKALWYGWGKV